MGTHPIFESDFDCLTESKARQNFHESDDCTFNYENVSYKVVRLFFDLLHPETDKEVSLSDALELMLFCNNEGQIDQKSDFETRLYEELSQQILEKMKDSRERCFIWMYLRTDPNHSVGEGLDKKIIQSINPDDYDMLWPLLLVQKRKHIEKSPKMTL